MATHPQPPGPAEVSSGLTKPLAAAAPSDLSIELGAGLGTRADDLKPSRRVTTANGTMEDVAPSRLGSR